MYDEAFIDLRNLYRGGVSKTGWSGNVRKEDVARWAGVSGLSLTQVFNCIGVELARDYNVGILTWEFCDAAANDLFAVLTELQIDGAIDFDEPKQFWSFYLAFDHSETVPPAEAETIAHEGIAQFLTSVPAGT